MDVTGHFTYVSPSVERLRGFSAEEVMTHSLDAALTPHSLEHAMAALAVAIEQVMSGRPLAVSYTPLTLATGALGLMSVVAGSLKKTKVAEKVRTWTIQDAMNTTQHDRAEIARTTR